MLRSIYTQGTYPDNEVSMTRCRAAVPKGTTRMKQCRETERLCAYEILGTEYLLCPKHSPGPRFSKSQEFILWYLAEREVQTEKMNPEDRARMTSVMAGPGTGNRQGTVDKLVEAGMLEAFEGTNKKVKRRGHPTRPAAATARVSWEKVTRYRLTEAGSKLGKGLLKGLQR